MKNSNSDRIAELNSLIVSKLKPLINNDFVLLDIPNHRNIGDSLIWKGEQIFFENLPFKCVGEYNRNTFQVNSIKSNKINILLHGGGNFGDIYRTSQNFRLQILKEFPNNRVILLPQTVYYKDNSVLKEDLELMRMHENFFICVRDQVSYDLVSPYFDSDKLFLLPDMAFCLNFDNKIKRSLGEKKILYMDRVDIEATERVDNEKLKMIVGLNKVSYLDWPTYNDKSRLLTKLHSYLEFQEGVLSMNLKTIPILKHLVHNAYGLKRRDGVNNYVKMGVNFINQYDIVLTTRLHGLILSVLLDKEIFVIDNSYGKCRTFYDTWLKEFDNIKFI